MNFLEVLFNVRLMFVIPLFISEKVVSRQKNHFGAINCRPREKKLPPAGGKPPVLKPGLE